MRQAALSPDEAGTSSKSIFTNFSLRAAKQDDLTRQVQAHPSICGHADQEVAVGDSTPFSRNPINPRPTPSGHTEGPSSMMSIKLVAQESGTSGLIRYAQNALYKPVLVLSLAPPCTRGKPTMCAMCPIMSAIGS